MTNREFKNRFLVELVDLQLLGAVVLIRHIVEDIVLHIFKGSAPVAQRGDVDRFFQIVANLRGRASELLEDRVRRDLEN